MIIVSGHLLEAVGAEPSRWWAAIEHACNRFEINTDQRIKMFLAQCAHESMGFQVLRENLHYSAAGLLRTWPKRFTVAEAQDFAYDDKRIAERVYGGRNGNGPEGSGDGYKYRGRGPIQITGLDNYEACGEAINSDLVGRPELLEQPSHGALAAAWFWYEAGCNELADADDFDGVSGAVNRGDPHKPALGMDDRRAWLAKLETAALA